MISWRQDLTFSLAPREKHGVSVAHRVLLFVEAAKETGARLSSAVRAEASVSCNQDHRWLVSYGGVVITLETRVARRGGI